MEKSQEVYVSIEKIKEVSFSFKPFPLPMEEITLGDNLSLGLSFSFKIDKEAELFFMQTTVNYIFKNEEDPSLEFTNEITFNVKNLKEVVTEKENNGLEIKDEFVVMLAGICIGTTRGLLSSNTKRTDWDCFPLPLLNPKEVVDSMNANSEEE
ncbi:hypothetical protein ACE01N_10825 [Saccharicrinis sp. FJH2]|uniref:hypothetical protein n=1 Tax=Saccharicrinis sp. FJH65 TaxID=3344659 RepID=UPI0035F308DB